jgi:hypothetical protein
MAHTCFLRFLNQCFIYWLNVFLPFKLIKGNTSIWRRGVLEPWLMTSSPFVQLTRRVQLEVSFIASQAQTVVRITACRNVLGPPCQILPLSTANERISVCGVSERYLLENLSLEITYQQKEHGSQVQFCNLSSIKPI